MFTLSVTSSIRHKESSALATLNEEVSGLGFTVIAAMFAIMECFLMGYILTSEREDLGLPPSYN